MGKELIHYLPRWCLWMTDLDPADVKRSPVLTARLEAVRKFRGASSAASTRAMAATAHLFGQRSQPDVEYLAIPQVFSQSREFITASLQVPEVIAGNKVYKAEDPGGFAFAIISSSMFIAWQKTIGGRIKHDPAFSNTLTWNTFPLQEISDKSRLAISRAGESINEVRTSHPERTLADHYTPGAMNPELLKAHAALDRAVDRAMAPRRKFDSNEQRAQFLFERYAELTGEDDRG